MPTENITPNCVEGERNILGSVLLNQYYLLEAEDKISPDDFFLDSHRLIFRRMCDINRQDRGIDFETLAQELDSHKELSSVGGRSYIIDLTSGLPRRPVIEDHIRLMKDFSVLRSLLSIAGSTQARAYDHGESAMEIAAWTDSAIQTLIETGRAPTDASSGAAEASIEFLDEFERRANLQEDDTISYGLMPEFDGLTGGMFPGEVTVIGGESGVGKSSAMIQALVFSGKRGIPSVCYSLEMTRAQVLGRICSVISRVPYRFIRFPQTANLEQRRDIRAAAYRIGEWPMQTFDQSGMTIGEIVASARIQIKRKGARLICVDYLQEIEVPGIKEERLKVSEAAKRLARVVKGTPAHMLMLSQLARREDNGIPQMKQLRESGKIENVAHCIALLWREFDRERGHHLTTGKVVVPKNRFGYTGNVDTIFNSDYAIFQ